jgi:hypothetical protein
MLRVGLRLLSSVASGGVKKSTGIVGLAVEPRAREVLVELYEKTLKDVQVRRRCWVPRWRHAVPVRLCAPAACRSRICYECPAWRAV